MIDCKYANRPYFGKKLKAWMAQYGYSNKNFAQTVGVNCSAFASWIAGKHAPTSENMAKIMKITNGHIKPEDFLHDKSR
jgi:hypothetical protein